jgi:hypothetical protein
MVVVYEGIMTCFYTYWDDEENLVSQEEEIRIARTNSRICGKDMQSGASCRAGLS